MVETRGGRYAINIKAYFFFPGKTTTHDFITVLFHIGFTILLVSIAAKLMSLYLKQSLTR